MYPVIARRRNRLNQRGDTIVEVLIAIAVISTVLGIAYASMNRGLYRMRDAQERIEALKIIEGQIESLRYSNSGSSVSIPGVGSNAFCITIGAATPVTVFSDGSVPTANLVDDDFSKYPSGADQCNKRFYYFGIKRESTKLFRFYVRWDKVGGRSNQDRNQIEMVYRTE